MFEARSREIAKKTGNPLVTPNRIWRAMWHRRVGPQVFIEGHTIQGPRHRHKAVAIPALCARPMGFVRGVGWEEPQEAGGSSRLMSLQGNSIFIKRIRDTHAYGFLRKWWLVADWFLGIHKTTRNETIEAGFIQTWMFYVKCMFLTGLINLFKVDRTYFLLNTIKNDIHA